MIEKEGEEIQPTNVGRIALKRPASGWIRQ